MKMRIEKKGGVMRGHWPNLLIYCYDPLKFISLIFCFPYSSPIKKGDSTQNRGKMDNTGEVGVLVKEKRQHWESWGSYQRWIRVLEIL